MRPRYGRTPSGSGRPARAAAMLLVLGALAWPVAVSARTTPTLPPSGSPAARRAHSVPGLLGLPSGAPPAAVASAPVLPEPTRAEWPFPSDFSATEGTGVLSGGASLWTDFVYDDHGAADDPAHQGSVSGLAPDHGNYTYPAGTGYDGNNADIFRAAVGFDGHATYWRVDWNTLPQPAIPIAEWTMTPAGGPAPARGWPGNAGLTTSTGIGHALLVTSTGAELVDPSTGRTMGTFPTAVDQAARSFIVKVPVSDLPVAGKWSIQLASGLADPSSQSPRFATVPSADGGLASGDGANAYNVTFRTYKQESALVCPDPPLDPGLVAALQSGLADHSTTDGVPTVECGNDWMENDQANTLSGVGPDVSKYALAVDWSQLREKVARPAPQVYGYSNRWYVTPLDLSRYGAGVRAADSTTFTGPTYLSRIQPYAVYVPSSYDFARPAPTPLTWILHSLGANLNQYGTLAPSQLAEVCQDRHSICATTEGFSDGGWYYAEAEVDFWDVWHQLAGAYDLDPDATTISGYSMGGWASYKLAEEYPDVFAQSEPLEGPVICGDRIAGSVQGFASAGQCTSDGDSTPLLGNLQWIPYVMTCGGIDELVPVTGCHPQATTMMGDGLRVDEFLYPIEDHLVFSLQNDFGPADAALGPEALDRKGDPGRFTFTWYPDLVSGAAGVDGAGAAGGIGPTRDYWVSGLAARAKAPGQTASVTAFSSAIPEATVTAVRSTSLHPVPGPTPYVENRQTWVLGATPATGQAVSLTLANVTALTVDSSAAGLGCGPITVRSDGPVTLTVAGLPIAGGNRVVDLPAGTTKVTGDCPA